MLHGRQTFKCIVVVVVVVVENIFDLCLVTKFEKLIKNFYEILCLSGQVN